ncbi:MAG: hypothetical protein ACLGHR_06275 [Gammaproteobacteria bacterium]
MAISTSIRQRGFAKWYERELLVGHAHLVLLVLCALGVLGSLEAFGQAGSERLLMALSLLVSAAIGVLALRRYLFHLMRAELIANQANCPACEVYGRWHIESADPGDAASGRPEAMQVCCRCCRHRWRIEG